MPEKSGHHFSLGKAQLTTTDWPSLVEPFHAVLARSPAMSWYRPSSGTWLRANQSRLHSPPRNVAAPPRAVLLGQWPNHERKRRPRCCKEPSLWPAKPRTGTVHVATDLPCHMHCTPPWCYAYRHCLQPKKATPRYEANGAAVHRHSWLNSKWWCLGPNVVARHRWEESMRCPIALPCHRHWSWHRSKSHQEVSTNRTFVKTGAKVHATARPFRLPRVRCWRRSEKTNADSRPSPGLEKLRAIGKRSRYSRVRSHTSPRCYEGDGASSIPITRKTWTMTGMAFEPHLPKKNPPESPSMITTSMRGANVARCCCCWKHQWLNWSHRHPLLNVLGFVLSITTASILSNVVLWRSYRCSCWWKFDHSMPVFGKPESIYANLALMPTLHCVQSNLSVWSCFSWAPSHHRPFAKLAVVHKHRKRHQGEMNSHEASW